LSSTVIHSNRTQFVTPQHSLARISFFIMISTVMPISALPAFVCCAKCKICCHFHQSRFKNPGFLIVIFYFTLLLFAIRFFFRSFFGDCKNVKNAIMIVRLLLKVFISMLSKLFLSTTLTAGTNRLECLSLAIFFFRQV
jgi:hypothetical protein